nr:hypothetical protein [Tanacetum cinerariifolium]
MTQEEVEELVTRRVAEEMKAREAAMNLESLNENKDEEEGKNGGNRNGGNRGNGNGENRHGNRGNGENGNGNGGRNGNGNRNRNHGLNYGGFMPVDRECTFQDFLKCKPHNFSGTEGAVGLTRWNSHKRTISVDVAYAMKWAGLIKLMTKELILLCTRMVPDEEDKVERFIGGLPDNIQGNVTIAEPTKLQDAIRIANNLMDQKLKGYARSAKNKRRLENNPRDNLFKWQNVGGQNVARAYTEENNERKGCGNCKRVGHQTRDCKFVVAAPNTQRAAVGNQPRI